MVGKAMLTKRWPRAALVLLGTLLLGDAIALISMGLFNFGVVLPGILGLAALALAWRWEAVARWRAASQRGQWLWRAAWLGFGAWLFTVALFFYFIDRGEAEPVPQVSSAAAIVVLGSGTPHCKVSPTLQARLDKGLMLTRRVPAVPVVVSGGLDFGQHCSEADVMADYMIGHGLAPDRLVREDRSTSTEENLRFSRQLLEQRGVGPAAPLVVVTSDFHVMRAERIARKAGFEAVSGVPAPTPAYLRYNAWLREYFAYISGWMLREY